MTNDGAVKFLEAIEDMWPGIEFDPSEGEWEFDCIDCQCVDPTDPRGCRCEIIRTTGKTITDAVKRGRKILLQRAKERQ